MPTDWHHPALCGRDSKAKAPGLTLEMDHFYSMTMKQLDMLFPNGVAVSCLPHRSYTLTRACLCLQQTKALGNGGDTAVWVY